MSTTSVSVLCVILKLY